MILALLFAAVTLDSTACASSLAVNCPHSTTAYVPGTLSVTSAAITTTAAGPVCVLVTHVGQGTTEPALQSVTSTGAFSTSLTRKAQTNTAGSFATVEVWCGVTSGALSVATFTALAATAGGTVGSWLLTILPFSTAVTFGVICNGGASTLTAATCAYTGTTSGSKLFVASSTGTPSPTFTAGTSLVQYFDDGAGDGTCAWQSTSTVAGGSITLGSTAPATGFTAAGIEIKDPVTPPTCVPSGMLLGVTAC